jgi:hypothetical protein
VPDIEFLILADRAEVVNGKLYMMGGGWSDLQRMPAAEDQPPPSSYLSIAVSVSVGWNETNETHRLTLTIENDDSSQQLAQLEGDIEVGRPPGIPPGSDQRALLAVSAAVAFPSPGTYRVVATLAGKTRTVTFRVHDMAMPRT